MREFAAGERFGGYIIEGLLGRGGMGVVYRARRETGLADRTVALKVVRPEFAADARFVARFREEARRAASVEHPAIVPVYDADEVDGVPFIAMRLVVGRDLAALLRARGPLAVDQVARMASELAGALDAAHVAGVVHRDVKPPNVLMDAAGNAYLTDFGLVRAVDGERGGHTSAGHVVGTLTYMAPEQTHAGAVVDGRADQYSLACTLFEALAGRPPYVTESDIDLALAHRIQAPEPVSAYAPDAAALDAPLLRALSKDPADRHPTCGDLARAIAAKREETGVGARQAPPSAAEPRRLPVAPSTLVGREREIRDVASTLMRPDARLVTVVGPGGAGKTRLALAALEALAGQIPDGVAFVDLGPISDAGRVASVVALTIGLREAVDQPIESTLAAYLQHRRMLLCLDNFEHVLPAATLVAELLAAAPGLTVLITSRAPLRLQGEHEYAVPPLDGDDAIELFAERARVLRPGFVLDESTRPTVAALCSRLDGLPLAIELAAARLRSLSPDALLVRIDHRLAVRGRGARDSPARQQTLRAAIDWSYDLLAVPERRLLARLAVFAGGCTLDAAEAVCGADVDALQALIENSLVKYDDDRYSLLETIREYAAERLAADNETVEFARRHADWLLALAIEADLGFFGRGPIPSLNLMELELNNARAAFASLSAQGATEHALELAVALFGLWDSRLPREGRDWLATALAAAPTASAVHRGRALLGAAHLAYFQGDFADAGQLLDQAMALFGRLGDHDLLATTVSRMALLAVEQGDRERQRQLAAQLELLLPTVQAPAVRADALTFLGITKINLGEHDAGLLDVEESLRLWRAVGNPLRASDTLGNLAFAHMLAGRYDQARALFEEHLTITRELGDRFRASITLCNLAMIAALDGNVEAAGRFAAESLPLVRERGDKRAGAESLIVAAAAVSTFAPRHAVTIAGATEELYAAMGGAPDKNDQRIRDRYVTPLRHRLEPAIFDEAAAEGHAMSFDAAIAFALACLGAEPPAAGVPSPPAQ